MNKLNPLIITSFGADGACAAAMILHHNPKADVITTSAGRIHETLHEICNGKTKYHEVYICGVGVRENIKEIQSQLKDLGSKKSKVFWYCGRNYLDSYKSMLEDYSQIIFKTDSSNTSLIRKWFKIKAGKISKQLVSIADEYAKDPKSISKDNYFYRMLITASESKYFKFEDRDAYIKVIYKLANINQITPDDQKIVALYENNENKKVPLGKSPAMKKVRSLVKKIGPIDEHVLIIGPTGAGKEIIARSIHEVSSRNGKFIPVNCAIFSTNADLAHDRLFGHVEGAFTDAKSNKPGGFEMADKGTLFLDEVAELPVPVQTQLLRVLEEGNYSPLGSLQTKQADVRVLAATNQNLVMMIHQGNFREDLYHRLNILRIKLPSLKERMEDVRSIVDSEIYSLKQKGITLTLKKKDWDSINQYDWPGNIRQLINLLKRSAYMALPLSEIIEEEKHDWVHLSSDQRTPSIYTPISLNDAKPMDVIHKSYAEYILSITNNNKTKAAKVLGISFNSLQKLLNS